MEIGLGLDTTLRLSPDDEVRLSQEAARLGYTSLWTPSGPGFESFDLCARRWEASRAVAPEGLGTGISVFPICAESGGTARLQDVVQLAQQAGTTSARTRSHFILGIGTGGVYRQETRRALGLPKLSTLALMRDYLAVLHSLLAGETVTYEGVAWRVDGARLDASLPPRTPVYLAALGPEMLRLSGELADGVALNWCSPEQTAWSRARIAEGAARAGRDPSAVQVIDYIRVCVDEDRDVARRSFTRMVMRYALGARVPSDRERQFGYRAHFERMGFTAALAELDRMRERGASEDELVDAFPRDLLHRVGYYGPAAGAAETVRRLGEGLDLAIVRVVAARPGADSVLAVMRACTPDRVRAGP